jgi:hypothetical protein
MGSGWLGRTTVVPTRAESRPSASSAAFRSLKLGINRHTVPDAYESDIANHAETAV